MSNIIKLGGGCGGSSVIVSKTITQNGTYSAQDDNADGYSEVSVDVAGREVDKVYFQNTFSRGDTPLTLTLLETANKTSHIKLTGSVWAPSIPTGYTATTGTISNNRFTTTETSEYHWDYVQEFDITCGNDNAVIVYNGELNYKSEVSLNVYHIYNLASKSITTNGTYRASDDGVDGYAEVTVDGAGDGIDYFESWIITNNTTTMSVHNEYNNDGSLSSCSVYGQAGNVTQVEGDMNIRIGSDTGWKWQMTATADMTYKIYDAVNGTLSELRTATNGTVVLSNVDMTGNITYEIRRYS